MRLPYLLAGPLLVVAGVSVAPTAAGDCATSGNTTICSIGGLDSSGPSMPYPCEYDWNCDEDYGLEFDLDADPGQGIGLPGTPGNRPGGGGGGNRPGGGGRR